VRLENALLPDRSAFVAFTKSGQAGKLPLRVVPLWPIVSAPDPLAAPPILGKLESVPIVFRSDSTIRSKMTNAVRLRRHRKVRLQMHLEISGGQSET
jgi:hypothetical protein